MNAPVGLESVASASSISAISLSLFAMKQLQWFGALVLSVAGLFVTKSGLVVFAQVLGTQRSPFTVELSERYLNPITLEVNTEARLINALRSDGSTAHSRAISGEVMSRQVIDVPSRRNAVVSDPDKTKSTRYFAESERLEIQRNAKRVDCAPNGQERPSREEMVMGVRALVFESESKLGSQLLKLTQWVAPELRCAEVRSVAEKLNQNREVIARTEKIPVAIRMGEPDASLFRIPDEYVELAPSEMQGKTHQIRYNREAPAGLRAGWASQDEKYYASQRHKP